MTTEIAVPETFLDIGKIEFFGKEGNFECDFDKIAISRNDMLYAVSIIAETQKVKAVRAILAGANKSIVVQGSGVNPQKPYRNQRLGQFQYRKIGRINTVPDGYYCFPNRLPFGMAQALFLSKAPGFLKMATPATLWQALKDPRYTTPLLPEWLPHIQSRLEEPMEYGAHPLLERLWCHRCECSLLSAETSDLDKIVQTGLQNGDLWIPEPEGEIEDTELRMAKQKLALTNGNTSV